MKKAAAKQQKQLWGQFLLVAGLTAPPPLRAHNAVLRCRGLCGSWPHHDPSIQNSGLSL